MHSNITSKFFTGVWQSGTEVVTALRNFASSSGVIFGNGNIGSLTTSKLYSKSVLDGDWKRMLCTSTSTPAGAAHTTIPQARNRFYKSVSIIQSEGEYEILLDQQKLKTPSGQVFKVPSESLAMAVGNEWDAQHDKILLSTMHMNSLCNTVLDNPTRTTKFDIVNHILSYLETDTLLCRQEEPLDLLAVQETEWDPVVQHVAERYHIVVEPSFSITGPTISTKARETLQKHLLSYDIWAVTGFMFGTEAIKSVILMLGAVDRLMTVEQTVALARLEYEFQAQKWGRVEWAHDVDMYEMQSRLAAAILFVHLTSSSALSKQKGAHA